MRASERLAALAEGRDPTLVMRMKSGFAVMGDHQFLLGYCLLLAYPEAGSLNELSHEARATFLHDMAMLGDAVQRVTECKRVNYGIYGNLDPFLHAHVVPRYEDEPEAFRTSPPMNYPEALRTQAETRYSPEAHGDLQDGLRMHLLDLMTHHVELRPIL